MPGALVYTDDDMNVVFCNDRFREMYPVPDNLLQPGRPYPGFLRFLAVNGYYGEGDRDELVARRIDSLRNPAKTNFEDRAPDGRIYRISRRRVGWELFAPFSGAKIPVPALYIAGDRDLV